MGFVFPGHPPHGSSGQYRISTDKRRWELLKSPFTTKMRPRGPTRSQSRTIHPKGARVLANQQKLVQELTFDYVK